MKIVYFSREEWEEDYVKGKLLSDDITFFKGTAQDYSTYEDKEAEAISVFVRSHVGKEEMDRFPNLRFIATRSTGFDHIDRNEAEKRGIVVSNVPFYGANTVAEYTFALLLNISRRIYEAYSRVLIKGEFSSVGLRGFDLEGKTLGVIGTGGIGTHTIKIAKGFGMDVLAFDVRHDDDLVKKFNFKYVDFDELLKKSDVITLHAPHNEHTHHMINMGNIDKIKKGAYLINTSRGALVETRALISALERDILAGAGMDVLEEEKYMDDDTELLVDEYPNPKELQIILANQYLIDHPRVVITPHNAFNTKEALERIVDTTVDNIKSFESGEPVNVVKNNKS